MNDQIYARHKLVEWQCPECGTTALHGLRATPLCRPCLFLPKVKVVALVRVVPAPPLTFIA